MESQSAYVKMEIHKHKQLCPDLLRSCSISVKGLVFYQTPLKTPSLYRWGKTDFFQW